MGKNMQRPSFDFFAILAIILNLLVVSFATFADIGLGEFNTIKLKDGSSLHFSSCSKRGDDCLRVVLTDGRIIKLCKDDLIEKDVKRYFGGDFKISKPYTGRLHYGKAVYVKSKLAQKFDPDKFKNAIKLRYEQLKKDVFNYPLYKMEYYYYVPDKKNIKKSEKVPLVVFLHGMTDEKWMNRHPQCLIFTQPEVQEKYPSYFLAPMLNKTGPWCGECNLNPSGCSLSMGVVIRIIDEMIKKYPDLDEDRIYITGLSSGGHGVWGAIAKFPGKFAGAVPMASGWEYLMKNMKYKQKIAIWAFCNPAEKKNTRFGTVKLLKRMVELGADGRYSKFQIAKYIIRKKKDKKSKSMTDTPPRIKIKFRHAAQNWAYAEPDLIPWLFAHKRDKNATLVYKQK